MTEQAPIAVGGVTDATRAVAGAVVDRLRLHGYETFTGVPCSLLRHLFAHVTHIGRSGCGRYIPAVREDAAVGVAAGMRLAGVKSVVLMQNSGLGYCLNVLTSLVSLYRIPMILIISWRGYDSNDAVEHTIIGQALPAVLQAIDVPTVHFDVTNPMCSVDQAVVAAAKGRGPCALLVSAQL